MQIIAVITAASAAGLVALAAAMTADPDKPVSGPPPGYSYTPTFEEEFEGSVVDGQRWTFAYYNPKSEKPGIAKRSLWNNSERQVYMDPEFLGLGINPFTMANGVLTIEGKPLPPAAKAIIAAEIALQPPAIANSALRNVEYSSGTITSRGSFRQKYGYFEIRARWTGGKGIWPAFWLLPDSGAWPPEIDVVEAHGDKPGMTYQTIHSKVAETSTKAPRKPAADGQFHTYGVLWLPDRLDFFIDESKTASFPTPADMHQPMYILANLAIGGSWPGFPDAKTPFPARMEIDYIRAWSISAPLSPK